MKCADGFALINGASNVQCKRPKCTKSQCCDKACSSFNCPGNFPLVKNSDAITCKKAGCTEALCCEKGERQIQRQGRRVRRTPLEFQDILYVKRLVATRNFATRVESVLYSCHWRLRLMISDSPRDRIPRVLHINIESIVLFIGWLIDSDHRCLSAVFCRNQPQRR